jgi:hypothetical protein
MRNHHPPAATCTAEPPVQPADHSILFLADQLTKAGYDTRSPAWEDRGYLKITNTPGALSELTITTSGHVTWEYRPTRPGHPEPARLATVIAGLLDPGTHLMTPEEPRVLRALITSVGVALARHGLTVTLDVLDVSQAFCDIYCELRITNPAWPERGTASLASDGTIWWESRTQPGQTLDAIAASIIRALADTAAPNWLPGTQHTACTST